MSDASIFRKETKILADATAVLEKLQKVWPRTCGPGTETGDVPVDPLTSCGPAKELEILCEAYAALLKNYDKIVRQSNILIRQSDRQHRHIQEANEALEQSRGRLEVRNRFIRNIFGRYLSDEIVDSLLDSPEGLRLGGDRRQVSILMSDLRGFTAISENLSPEDVVRILNIYLEAMTDIILRYKGTINEILGDSLLVIFGAPLVLEDDADRAIACAMEMQRAMVTVNEKIKEIDDRIELNMGVAVHTGLVVAGNIGSEKRSKYAVVGRHVNLTGRIESCSLPGQVLISETARQRCGGQLRIDNSMEIRPKGTSEPITIYQVGAIKGRFQAAIPCSDVERFRELTTPLPVQFRIVNNKQAEPKEHEGLIVELNKSGARMKKDMVLTPLQDLEITLHPLTSPGEKPSVYSGVFAKIQRIGPNGDDQVEMIFTYLSPEANRFLETQQGLN